MKKFMLLSLFVLFTAWVLVQSAGGKGPLVPVFRMTAEPQVLVQGSRGAALTVDVSFGDSEIREWVSGLSEPYPLLFIDPDWLARSPDIVKLLVEKNIPVGLLGAAGERYAKEPKLLDEGIEAFESYFGRKPLYFRTADERFPEKLTARLFELEINALGSTRRWEGGKIPKEKAGEILSVQHHRDVRTEVKEIERLRTSREFMTVEDVLFGVDVRQKSIP
ncbi:polysaccharide deacetylase family protein [Edaphobacillus lindanitolerans]|uniref:Uncharacterized protein n=1 Tax=Edaphobacillus lindanitolerans TaxID=550447 RepID=A0A1U7PS23_9BACI|nr:hypothetical protein [Edaphobacillus lindanitolerans]SIT88036.1 hypothetical protein SAMN05428946_2210 [Edaphobacillus lindanitolerans]